MRFIAYTLSVLLHPILVPIYLFLILAEIEPVLSLYFSGTIKWRFAFSLFVTTVLGPVFSIYIMKRRGMIADMDLSDLRGRSAVYLITSIYYLLTYFMFTGIELPSILKALFLGLVLILMLLAVISLRYKISAHMTAMGGASAVLCWVFQFYGIWQTSWFMIAVLLSAVVASSRLGLQAHSMDQVASGYALGALGMYITLWSFI